jgi:thiamine-phosphate pyrophosphorylase
MTGVDPTLYLVLDPVRTAGADHVLVAALAGGVTAVQVRIPDVPTPERRAAVERVCARIAGTGVALVVDDDLDAALEAGADGVHLGQRDLPPVQARRRAGAGFSIGWSVSRTDHVDVLAQWPAGTVDLLGAGPVFPTGTKTDADPPLGLTGLAGIVALAHPTSVPVVAIGGITPRNAGAVMATGVDGVAVSSAITTADDPGRAAGDLRAAVGR